MKNQLSAKTKLVNFLNDFGIAYESFDDPKFICEDAKSHGACESICVRNVLDFNFNAQGELVGTNSDGSTTFQATKDLEFGSLLVLPKTLTEINKSA
jgi:hypothetical protein